MLIAPLVIAMAMAQSEPCPVARPTRAPTEAPLSEARRSVDSYWNSWSKWCAAPAGTVPLAPLVGQALDLLTSLEDRLRRHVETGLGEGPGRHPYEAKPFPPGIALLFGEYFQLDEGDFVAAARARGSKADRTFWDLYDSFTWRGAGQASPSNAIQHGIMEPGDPGCLLLDSTDLVGSVSALLSLEAAATTPPYRQLASWRRKEVLGPLERAAREGGCLCSDSPRVTTSLQALAQARKNGGPWRPFSDAASQILATLHTPNRFKVLVNYECRPRSPK
jgi:hypothetical protein